MTLKSTFADELFEATAMWQKRDFELWDKLIDIMGFNNLEKEYPFEDVSYDLYDYSFEFKKMDVGVHLTPAQIQAFKELGFKRLWVCHKDGTEEYISLEK